MRLEHLKYLIEIDRFHSISAAARELYIGQTALSSNLQPAHLLCSPAVSHSLALPLSREFVEREDFGNLFFHVITGSEVVNRIMRNEFSIGLTYFTPSDYASFLIAARKYQIQSKLVYDDRYHILMRSDHPMAGRQTLDLSELCTMEFAMLPHFSINEDFLEFIKSLQREKRFTTYSSVLLIKQAILEHNILGILPGFSLGSGCGGDGARLKAVELTGVPSTNEMDLCLMYNQRNLRYLEKSLLLCIEQFFSRLNQSGAGEGP